MEFEENFLAMIVQKYETEVMKKQTAKGFKLMLVKTVNDLKVLSSVTKNVTNSFPGSKFDFEERPDEVNNKNTKKTSSDSLKKAGLESVSENALSDYLERCFGCNTRLTFDYQFLPPEGGFLDQLNAVIEDAIALLEQLEKSFDSKKKVEQLCAVAALFNSVPCPQDILTIILGLKVLLGKYTSLGLSLKLDWLTLLGPIIQAFVQILNMLINLIFDAIVGPFECTLAVMNSGLALIRALDPASFATSLNKNEDAASNPLTMEIAAIRGPTNDSFGSINTFSITPSQSGQLFGDPKEYETKMGFNPSNTLLVPTGGAKLDLKISDLMEPKSGQANFMDLSVPEQLIIAVNEAINYLNDFRDKILATVGALNGLVRTGKFLEIRSMAAAIFIAELISFLIQLLNTDFKTLCSDPQKAPALENVIKEMIGAADVKIATSLTTGEPTARITSVEGIAEEITLNSCSMSHNSVNLDEIQKVLAEIERLTNG